MPFGNRTGWTLAVAILAIEGLAVRYALSFDAPTPATDLSRRPEATTPLAFEVDPHTLVDPTESGRDAAAIYRDAADAYAASPYVVDRFLRTRDRTMRATLPHVDAIVEATTLKATSRLIDFPGYDDEPKRLAALKTLGDATIVAGLFASVDGDAKRSRQLYDAGFSLGLRLAEERSSWRSFAAGVELMSTAAAARAELADKVRDVADSARCRSFQHALRDRFRDAWLPLFERIDTRREPLIATHAGDLVAIATDPNADRLFRTAAILKLGRMRFNLGEPPNIGDRAAVARALDWLEAREQDPTLRKATTLARTLSVEQFRTLR